MQLTEHLVRRQAAHAGLILDAVGHGAAEDRWHLVSRPNWMTTDPGRPLAEIKAELDERDGGAWQAKQDEIEAEKAQQQA